MWKVVYYLTPSSFCFGVERAVNGLSAIVASHQPNGQAGPWDKVFCVHALVHNPKVTKDFEDRWVAFVESIYDIPDDDAVVVFSAHGINRVVLEQARARFKAVYNLECPFVSKIYQEVDASLQKWISTFFYVGKKYHQEKKNVVDYIQAKWGTVYVFQNKDQIPRIDPAVPLAALSQTTMDYAHVCDILKEIKKRYPLAQLLLLSDVCKATYERQVIVSDNLDKFEAFVVIWGKESNNSKELSDIWIKYGKKTFYGENLDDILTYPKEELFACDTVAVTWWASTPAEDIKAVFDFYRENWYEPKILSL